MSRSIFLLFAAVLLNGQTFEQHALAISRDIQARHVPFGTILNPMFASAGSNEIVAYTRCGDSAIWTGHWLAAESFRYRVTRSPEALEAARAALRGIQSLVDVTGSSNLLARCVLRVGSPLAAAPRAEEASHGEYTGKIGGVDHYWIGHTSRDQYMGVFFGLSVAYEHLEFPDVRAAIADVATRLIDRLLAKNWAVVMPDGDTSTVFWLRPDQQLSILQVGRQVNPARFASIYRETDGGLFGVGAAVSLEAREEHESYFKFNLAAITFYNLIRLEPAGSSERRDYLSAYDTFRRAVDDHGNAFFNVIDRAIYGPRAARDAETMELMAAWLLRPRRDAWVDLRGKYRACGSDRACDPIPVTERVRTDFLWQRSPFLLYGGGEGRIESPGIDFILPYWMGRYYGLDFSLLAASAASGTAAFAPESLASLYGGGFAEGVRVDVQDALGATRPATLLFTSPSQINFVVPAGTVSGAARIVVTRPDGTVSHSTVVSVARSAPALFAAAANGRGPAAALAVRVETDGRQSPVAVFRCSGPLICFTDAIDVRSRPVYLSLYGTGVRNREAPAVTVTVGGRAVPVHYAGAQAQFAGLDQINVQLPASLRGLGRADVIAIVDGIASNAVQIEID